MRVFFLAAAVVVGGCGPSDYPPIATPHPQLAAVRLVDASDANPPVSLRAKPPRRHAKLSFELNGRAFPLPVVHGTIAGHPTWMLVDTGANSHILAGWFANKVSLATTKIPDVATDHAGKAIATSRVERPSMLIDDWGELEMGPILVTEVPDVIEKLGIGAFISPQKLQEDGDAVILDLRAGEIRATSWDEVTASENAFTDMGARTCEDTQSPFKGLAYVAPANIAGQSAWLLLDTGAQRSDLLLGSKAGKTLAPKSVGNKQQVYGASGKLRSRTVPHTKVTVGAAEYVLDVDLIGGESDTFCPRDGALSMDVLKGCVLVLGRKKVAAKCGPPK